MSTHNICLIGEIIKIIPELSLNTNHKTSEFYVTIRDKNVKKWSVLYTTSPCIDILLYVYLKPDWYIYMCSKSLRIFIGIIDDQYKQVLDWEVCIGYTLGSVFAKTSWKILSLI